MSSSPPEFHYGLGSKTERALSEVMNEPEKAEARYLDVIQIIQPARPRQTPANSRLTEDRLKDAGDIRAVVDQRVPRRAALSLVTKLAPKIANTGPTSH
jgi:hypothetical protein